MSDATSKVRRKTAGDDAPAISLPDVGGQRVSIDYAANAVTVVAFTSNGCPYALAWHDRIQRLATGYASQGLQLVQVVCNDDDLQPKDSLEGMRARVAAGEVRGTYLKDARQSVTAAFGATATPEIFVVDSQGVIRYHGAPDADYDDPSQNAQFVREAVDSLLDGRAVHRATTSPAGCSVKWRVELLWWAGCPSHGEAEDLLRAALDELGRARQRGRARPEQAVDRSFPGSPTFQVGDNDLFAVDAPPALACRTYQRADGRLSPLPASDDLVARLRESLARPWDLPGWTDHRKTASRSAGA